MSGPALLELAGIRKRFGAVQALDGVDLRCGAGTIHALLGENGAGKSTLMHVVAGLQAADGGSMRLAGREVVWRSPEQARAAGVSMVHQHFMLVPTMTIAENVALARGDVGPFRAARLAAEVTHLARARRLEIGDPQRVVEELSVGEQQRVEILKALVAPTRLLILDEPTAVLTPDEVEGLFTLLRELAAGGTAIVIVTHKLREALSLADHVTVLRRGRVSGSGPASRFDEESLAALMVEEPEDLRRADAERLPPPGPDAPVVLRVRGLSGRDRRGVPLLDDVSLDVRAGGIAVVAGVEGNGQTELVAALAGLAREDLGDVHGEVAICGRQVHDAAEARAAGLAVVPPDRTRDGLVASLELWENLLLAHDELHAVARRGVLRRREARSEAAQRLAAFGVRPDDPTLPAGALSGGNQQRMVLARELGRRNLRAVVAANPTRGLDLAATVAVHRRLRELAARGIAVLVLSTDLDEVEALAGEVYVLYRGRLTGPLARPLHRLDVGRLMAGVGVAA
ncbi:MAG: ATP-binding cassette domain-containing protein [Thermodesulfobacteriota bacterium]